MNNLQSEQHKQASAVSSSAIGSIEFEGHQLPILLTDNTIRFLPTSNTRIDSDNTKIAQDVVYFYKNSFSLRELQNIQATLIATNPQIPKEQLNFEILGYHRILDFDVISTKSSVAELWQAALLENHFDLLIPAKIDLPTLTKPGVLVMDMDSTAIEIECIDEIAKLAGVGESVSEVTERAMRGELDFEQSLRQRVSKLNGASESILQTVLDDLPIMQGLNELVTTLLKHNWIVAIASGGFTYFAQSLKETFDLSAVFANQLEIIDGKLTGNLVGNIIDAKAKSDILIRLANEHAISMTQTVAIGDGANDLPMINTAALGVAFHAKPKVEKQANVAIRFADLTALLLILNLSSLKG